MSVMIIDLFVLLSLFVLQVLAVSVVAIDIISSLLLIHVRIDKEFAIVNQIIAKDWQEDKILTMVEVSLTVHFTISPVANVHVTDLRELVFTLFWPNVTAIATFNSISQSTTVFTTVLVDHVTITSPHIMEPVTSVTTVTICIDLDTKSMAHSLKLFLQLFSNLRDIINNQGFLASELGIKVRIHL